EFHGSRVMPLQVIAASDKDLLTLLREVVVATRQDRQERRNDCKRPASPTSKICHADVHVILSVVLRGADRFSGRSAHDPEEHGKSHDETSRIEVADGNSTSLAQI